MESMSWKAKMKCLPVTVRESNDRKLLKPRPIKTWESDVFQDLHHLKEQPSAFYGGLPKTFEGSDDDILIKTPVEEVPICNLGVDWRPEVQDRHLYVRSPYEASDDRHRKSKPKDSKKVFDTFQEGSVTSGTEKALNEFIGWLPAQKFGTHGVILDEDMDPVGGQYKEDIHYLPMKDLGSGSFGKVVMCQDTDSEKVFVRKEVEKETLRDSEIIIPLSLKHKNITRFLGVMQVEEEKAPGIVKIHLMMEYGGQSLCNFLLLNIITESMIFEMSKDGLCALEVLHQYGMNHFDVKPDNLVVQLISGKPLMKLTDFGTAKLAQEKITFNGWTPEYMAPESCKLVLQERLSELNWNLTQTDITGKADVFPFALVIMYMYTKVHVLLRLITMGKTSYANYTEQECKLFHTQLLISLAGDKSLVKNLIPDKCCIEMRSLLRKMTEHDPKDRLSSKEARQTIEEYQKLKDSQNHMTMMPVPPHTAKSKPHAQQQHSVQETTKTQDSVPETAANIMDQETGPIRNAVKAKLRDKLSKQRKPYAVPSKKYLEPPPTPTVPETPVAELSKLTLDTAGTEHPGFTFNTGEMVTVEQQQYQMETIPQVVQDGEFSPLSFHDLIDMQPTIPTPSLVDCGDIDFLTLLTEGAAGGFQGGQIFLQVSESEPEPVGGGVVEICGNVPNFDFL